MLINKLFLILCLFNGMQPSENPPSFTKLWSYNYVEKGWGSCTAGWADNGVLYLEMLKENSQGSSTYILKLNESNHKAIWLKKLELSMGSNIYVANDNLIIYSYISMICLSTKDGHKLWEIHNRGNEIELYYTKNNVLAGNNLSNQAYFEIKFDPKTGKKVKETESITNYLMKLNPSTGKTNWKLTNISSFDDFLVMDEKTNKLFIRSNKNQITVYDLRNGKRLNSFIIDTPQHFICENGRLLVISLKGVQCFDCNDYKKLWDYDAPQTTTEDFLSNDPRTFQKMMIGTERGMGFPSRVSDGVLYLERPVYEEILMIDLNKGEFIGKIPTENITGSNLFVYNDTLVSVRMLPFDMNKAMSGAEPNITAFLTAYNTKNKKVAALSRVENMRSRLVFDPITRTFIQFSNNSINAWRFIESK